MTDYRRLAWGVFAAHGVGDLVTTLACAAVLGPEAEFNPLMRLALSHGPLAASVVMLSVVAVAAVAYLLIGERYDPPGWRAFGVAQICLGVAVSVANLSVLVI